MQTHHKRTAQSRRLIALIIVVVLISSSAIIFSNRTDATQPAEPPNILVIMADDLGYGDLGSYGSELIQTPNIDRLRQEGMKFNQYYANAPVCSPTRAAMLTGQYPSRFSLRFICSQATQTGLPETVSLPRVLSEAGYSTHHIGKWHLGPDDPEFTPTGLGFDDSFGFLFSSHLNEARGYIDPQLKTNNEPYVQYTGHLTDILGDRVIDTIKESNDEPFFISYWPFAPHRPVQPPERWASQYPDTVEGQYAALVSALDENVGRILDTLEEEGLASNTIVIFTSDNGGAAKTHPAGNANLRGFKHDLFEGGIKVPFIIKWPNQIAPDSEVDDVVLSFDLLPTLAEILDLNLDQYRIDGQSFLPVLFGQPYTTPYPLFWEYRNPKHSDVVSFVARQDKWKLVFEQGERFLFDLDTDPSESVNLINDYPDVASNLQTLYQEWRWQTTPLEYTIDSTVGDVVMQDEVISFGEDGGLLLIENNPKFNPDIFEFTFSTWIKQSECTVEQDQQIAGKGGDWGLIYTPQHELRLFLSIRNGKNDIILTSSTELEPNTWHHIAFTMANQEEIWLYIDGQLTASEPTLPIHANKEPVALGNNMAMQAPFSGSIYDPRFFNAELTGAEITTLAQSASDVLVSDSGLSGGCD